MVIIWGASYHFTSLVGLSPAQIRPSACWIHINGSVEAADGSRQVALV